MDISGLWETNKPPLMYMFEKDGQNGTWSIPGSELFGPKLSGPFTIDRLNIRANVDDVWIPFVISKVDDKGRPIEITSSHEDYRDLIIFRQ